MKEAEWLASGDPHAMLSHLRRALTMPTALYYTATGQLLTPQPIPELRTGRYTAFAIHCVELVAGPSAAGSPLASVIEHYYRGDITNRRVLEELDALPADQPELVRGGSYPMRFVPLNTDTLRELVARVAFWQVAQAAAAGARQDDPAVRLAVQREAARRLAITLRDIVGNPFRPTAFAPEWRTATTVGLAQAIYAGRTFYDLPVLAAALEEAGCDAAELLAHCRNTSLTHVRGCWAVDLVLGKA